MNKMLFTLFVLFVFLTWIGATELGDILMPYDDDGFYGGSIIILFLIYVGIPFIFIGSFLLFVVFPKLLSEFKMLIHLYYTMELKKAVKKHLIHLFIFTTLELLLIYLVYTVFEVSYFYLFMLLIYLYSSFFGFYIFLYFVMAMYFKNWKKVFIALILGAGVSIFFILSTYFVFEPIYLFYTANSTHVMK